MKPLPSLPEGRRKTIRMATLSLGEVRGGFILHSSLKLILPHSFSGVRNFFLSFTMTVPFGGVASEMRRPERS